MAISRMLRRSGVAIVTVVEWLDWRPDTVYQVGVGQFHQEVDVMAECWPGVAFFGCEPNPSIVNKTIDYPGQLLSCAVGDHDGTATLWWTRKHKDGGSLYPFDSNEHTDVEVDLHTLDSLYLDGVQAAGRVLLWLDCEGSELAVLQGGERFMEHVDAVNVEMTSQAPWIEGKRIGQAMVDVHRWLIEHGFWRQWVHTQRNRGQHDAIYVRSEIFQVRCCCSPTEIERWYNTIDKEDEK